MTRAKRKFLKGLLNGLGAAIGVLLTVDLMAGASISPSVLMGAGLTGLGLAVADWKAALDAKR